ncbi:sodium/proton antiporter, CPA1 family [Dyadobacter koreensis]|uniref:Sodium/proton antiporter, CPA1 family n=1 Tax=Dyadobacter koreensis TaxID=408657 RepID=A0A1H6RP81_9BACT|nr:Na+/H+ antiporter [Dyadobacter koreensis]SEI53002.1 sodium/proton antiporter, CPA1 family [Dyadobacter koreensis]
MAQDTVQDNLLIVISLLFGVSMLTMLSEKLRISYPIFLVIAGLLISFIPGIPHISLEPDWVFLLFLPPLLYFAAWNTSWKDFWFFKRSIGLLSIGLVVFTATAVAYLSNAMIPDFTLAMGFVLGGIISPPDAVAATSVLQGLKIPRRVVTILEGESLVNDASSLIVFRVALATLMTGQFVFWKAGVDFFVVAIMGIIIGLAIAHVLYYVHKFFPTTSSIDTALTFIAPYLMYIGAEHFHFSGVLATVSGGLFLSYRSNEIFSYNSRMQSQYVWETVVFLLNGIVFIMIGLQLPDIIDGLGQNSIGEAVFYSVVISIVTILIRIIWVFPSTYLPRILSSRIREKEERPSWQPVFIVAWSGMRGVVSLASGLAVPLTLTNSTVAFPQRNLILFITFVVILFTLVLQGLSLPYLIKWLNITDDGGNEEEQEIAVRLRLATASLSHMQASYGEEVQMIDAFSRLKERYERMIDNANNRLVEKDNKNAIADFLPKYRKMLVEIVSIKRDELQKLRRERIYSDEILKARERELDFEEARLRDSP